LTCCSWSICGRSSRILKWMLFLIFKCNTLTNYDLHHIFVMIVWTDITFYWPEVKNNSLQATHGMVCVMISFENLTVTISDVMLCASDIYCILLLLLFLHLFLLFCHLNRIGGVMVSVLFLSVVDRGFEPRSGQTKDYKIGICCFSA
jgi:hypothetical protein